jgi:hypothetical protein
MVIFCVYTRKRAKKPPNSEAYADRKKTFAPSETKFAPSKKKCSRLFFSLYVYTLKEITALCREKNYFWDKTQNRILTSLGDIRNCSKLF